MRTCCGARNRKRVSKQRCALCCADASRCARPRCGVSGLVAPLRAFLHSRTVLDGCSRSNRTPLNATLRTRPAPLLLLFRFARRGRRRVKNRDRFNCSRCIARGNSLAITSSSSSSSSAPARGNTFSSSSELILATFSQKLFSSHSLAATHNINRSIVFSLLLLMTR